MKIRWRNPKKKTLRSTLFPDDGILYNHTKEKQKKGKNFPIKVEVIATTKGWSSPSKWIKLQNALSHTETKKPFFFFFTFPDHGITSNPMNKFTCWIPTIKKRVKQKNWKEKGISQGKRKIKHDKQVLSEWHSLWS